MEPEPKLEITSVAQRGPESSLADLHELAERIKEEHINVASALQQGFMHASAAGELLIQAKAKAGHGKWLSWLRDECEISVRTASLYMRLAKNRRGIEDQIGNAVADLTLRGAVKLLSPPRQSDPHAGEMAEGSAGAVSAPAGDPMAIGDNRKILKTKKRRCTSNADGPSAPSTESPSSADPAPSSSARDGEQTHRDAAAAEDFALWLPRYEAVKAKQAALIQELEELYRPFEAKMDELVHRIEDVDGEACRINDAKPFAPHGDCRLLGNTELVARASGLSTMKYLNLPAWERNSPPARPPQWLLPLQMAASMGSRSAAEELDRAHRRALNQGPGLGG